ncbi:MAG: PspA/IM30 family protein [Cyanobacteria bacterium TGS_CYA1]|nr:PspA/IM30 family protein [Cyanobacteria bacterium TGS_CYA1]MDX2108518.1 PspA/IM30 family protein [Candidatus Melainabacteria bacterium]
MFQRMVTVFKAMINSLLGKVEDPQMMLEQAYQDLQSNLIQVRQAVAQAIATEKQLEQQLKKNVEQVDVWQTRAGMAVQQGNDDLARQALQRKQQYASAVKDLETQLQAQKEITAGLRRRLAELEAEASKTYTKKQVLIARDKAAQATSKANEILSKTNSQGASSIMERMELKVQENEAKAQALAELGRDNLDSAFASFEGASDIEMELLALKAGDSSKLITQKKDGPILLDLKDSDTVDAEVEVSDAQRKE